LANNIDVDFDEGAFLDHCLRVGRQWVLERRLASEESLSTEMFRPALKLARHRGLFDTADATLPDRRAAFLREVDQVRRDVAFIGEIARQRDGIAELVAALSYG
jgi:glycerol-3-phosphate O-acyltransferase